MRACDWRATRPLLQKAFGEEVEELIFLFPSAHASIYREDGLLHAPLGKDFTVTCFATVSGAPACLSACWPACLAA